MGPGRRRRSRPTRSAPGLDGRTASPSADGISPRTVARPLAHSRPRSDSGAAHDALRVVPVRTQLSQHNALAQTPKTHSRPGVKQSLGLVSLVVRDYDEALCFFVGKLGFVLIEDSFVPEQSKRWVVV